MRMNVKLKLAFPDFPVKNSEEYRHIMNSMAQETHKLQHNLLNATAEDGDREYYDELASVYNMLLHNEHETKRSVDPLSIDFGIYDRLNKAHGCRVEATVSKSGPMFYDCRDMYDSRYYNHIEGVFDKKCGSGFNFTHENTDGTIDPDAHRINIPDTLHIQNVKDVVKVVKEDIGANIASMQADAQADASHVMEDVAYEY